jgi:hypothetical protein
MAVSIATLLERQLSQIPRITELTSLVLVEMLTLLVEETHR